MIYRNTRVYYAHAYVIGLKKNLICISFRQMQTATKVRNLLFRGNIHHNATSVLEPPQKLCRRTQAMWTGRIRVQDAKNEKNPPPMATDQETGLEIMRPYDSSVKNHILLVDDDFKHDLYYKVHGSFTTSSTFYEKVPPDMVAGVTLEGQIKPQFLHRYHKPRLIEKNAVMLHEEATVSLTHPEYTEYLKTINTKSD